MIRDQNLISSRGLETKGSGISEYTPHFHTIIICVRFVLYPQKLRRVYRSTVGTLNLIIKYKW